MSKQKSSGWPPPQRQVRAHDARAYKARQGQRYNSKPPTGGCMQQLGVLGAIVAALVAMIRGAR